MKIKEPDWKLFLRHNHQQTMVVEMVEWFRLNIKPFDFHDPKDELELFSDDPSQMVWTLYRQDPILHTAKLIYRKTIVEEDTHEKVLRDLIKQYKSYDIECAEPGVMNILVKRAKAVLK